MSSDDDLRTILVATDGSPSACQAIDFAVQLAAEHDADLVCVHVVPTLDFASHVAGQPGYALRHEPTGRDRAVLDEAAAIATEHGVAAKTVLLGGSTAQQIVAYAESSGADLIVIGTRGHSAMAKALLGSVSLSVLRRSKRPVLIVRSTSTPSRRKPRRARRRRESL
jgi:nucleotide-binding universal stress UspA family protein